jgi:hypothetical protein
MSANRDFPLQLKKGTFALAALRATSSLAFPGAMSAKECCQCGQTKPYSEFYSRKDRDGRRVPLPDLQELLRARKPLCQSQLLQAPKGRAGITTATAATADRSFASLRFVQTLFDQAVAVRNAIVLRDLADAKSSGRNILAFSR